MNKLVIIGNGFDLAHGLKTSYADFILWYFWEISKKLHEKSIYFDELVLFKNEIAHVDYDRHDFIDINLILNNDLIHKEFKSQFFRDMIKDYDYKKWIDIESFYYQTLVDFYLRIEANRRDGLEFIPREVGNLNNEFAYIKEMLQEYLTTISIDRGLKKNDIENHINAIFHDDLNQIEKVIFLNFNYTNTIELYVENIDKRKFEIINIHGEINSSENPIIFGYGDEMDDYYKKMESLNKNEFLENFKSFGYFNTLEFRRISRFLRDYKYDVFIMGHSCGLSDRVLLNRIFEPENCREINILFYQRSETEDDFLSKTREISRHFQLENKGVMRDKIVPKPISKPLVKYRG